MTDLHNLSPTAILALEEIMPEVDLTSRVLQYLRDTQGDIKRVISKLVDEDEDRAAIDRIGLALNVLWAFSEDMPAAQAVFTARKYKSLRDVAQNFIALRDALAPKAQVDFSKRMYDLDATGCIISLLGSKTFNKTPGASAAADILKENADFSLERDSVWGLSIHTSDAEQKVAVDLLKTLQRLQAVVVSVDELSYLYSAGFRSAVQITKLSDDGFVSELADSGIGSRDASAIKRSAAAVRARNEHVLMLRAHSSISEQINVPVLRSATRGVSLKPKSVQTMSLAGDVGILDEKTGGQGQDAEDEPPDDLPINLDSLFGNALSVACKDCCSVTSPAAYFVDLMHFLKGIELKGPTYKTVLAALTARRPDLQNLQLSCENTDVALPYIDLSNEILEACVAHQAHQAQDAEKGPDPVLPAYNVSSRDKSASLIEAPRNVNSEATKELSKSISISLPYDHEADRLAQALAQLGVSWTDVLETFNDQRPKSSADPGVSTGQSLQQSVSGQLSASYLKLSKLDYDLMAMPSDSFPGKTANGVYNVWGYDDISQHSSVRVKGFAACVGIDVDELVGLLDTPYINPAKFDLSQLEVDFLELVAPYGTDLENGMADERVNIYLKSTPLDVAQFKATWLKQTAARVKDIVVVNIPPGASGNSLDLNNMTLVAVGDGKLSPAHFQRFWTVLKLSKSMDWTLAQTSRALHRSSQLASSNAQMLEYLSYFVRLSELLSIGVDDLLDLWVTFTGTAAGSDYASVFLRPELLDSGGPSYIFLPDNGGKLPFQNPTAPAKLSSYESEIAAAFGCTVQDLQSLVSALSSTKPDAILNNTGDTPAVLTLPNLSILFRWHSLRKTIGMDSASFSKFIAMFPLCLTDAIFLFQTLSDWQKLGNLGLKIDTVFGALPKSLSQSLELDKSTAKGMPIIFSLRRKWTDLQSRLPNLPPDKQVTDEELALPSLPIDKQVTDEDVRAVTPVLHDAATVEAIVAFLNGLYVYFDETIALPAPVFKDSTTGCAKVTCVKVDDSHFKLRIVGLLSVKEAKAILDSMLFTESNETAVRRVAEILKWAAKDSGMQVFSTLVSTASGGLQAPEDLRSVLLQPDDATTAIIAERKRRAYLNYFIPAAREYLIHKALNDALQAFVGSLDPLALEFLLHNIKVGQKDAASGNVTLGTVAQKLAEAISPDIRLGDEVQVPGGKLGLPEDQDEGEGEGEDTSDTAPISHSFFLDVEAADSYTFFSSNLSADVAVTVAGTRLVFDADKEFESQAITLQAQITTMQIIGPANAVQKVEWQRTGGVKSVLPTMSILTIDEVGGCLAPALNILSVLADLVVTLGLDTNELVYLSSTYLGNVHLYSAESSASLIIGSIMDLGLYCEARALLGTLSSKKNKSLLELLKWTFGSTRAAVCDVDELSAMLNSMYGWDAEVCALLLSADLYKKGARISEFIRHMLKVMEQLSLAGKLGAKGKPAAVQALFDLASPPSYLEPAELEARTNTISKLAVLAAGKSSPNQRKEMHNGLRERRRDALVSYLTQCEYFRSQTPPITDPDLLFEHLLIDSQINSAMITSRLKQAISTIQLYVQRCLLGLEDTHGVPSEAIDEKEWSWMQKYTLWQANREVFLYPENWLDPSLRPLKSEQYRKFETKLTASDATQDRLEPAIRDYITGVVDIANLEPVALYWDTMPDWETVPDASGMIEDIGRPSGRVPKTLHIFARTRHKPYAFYYRTRDCKSTKYFTPWEKVEVDIPVYETDSKGQPLATPGVHMVVYRTNGRLMMLLPQFTLVTEPTQPGGSTTVTQEAGSYKATSALSKKSWTLRFGVSAYVNGKWTPKQVFNDIIPSRPLTGHLDRMPDEKGFNENVFGEYGYSGSTDGTAATSNHKSCYQELLSDSIPAAIEKYRFWPYRAENDDKNMLRVDVSWHCPCKWFPVQEVKDAKTGVVTKAIPQGHRCVVAQVVFRCGRLQPGTETPSRKLYREPSSSASALSQREIFDTVFSKAASQYDVPDTITKGLRPVWLDPDSTDVHFDGGNALMSFQDQRDWTDSSPLVYITEPYAKGIGVASALNFDDRIAPEWDSKHRDSKKIKRIPMVYAQADELASKATWGIDSVYDYLHSLKPDEYQKFTASGDLEFCEDSTLTFGPDAQEMTAPYSQYHAELGIHMPMAMMARFAASQQFDAALAAGRLIFNPLESGIKTKRCWKWPPFSILNVVNDVQDLLTQVADDKRKGSTDLNGAVEDWRENPFSPYAVARSRPSTYMKWVVAKYIEVLIAYGDSYFRQNTLESIPYALNLYVQASKLFGPAPQTLRDPGTKRTATYATLEANLDAFSTALVDMEVQFPFVVRSVSNQHPGDVAGGTASTMALNVVGTAMTNYFCLPANPKLRQLRDLIDDRLYKIRNYLDINGHPQVLPLFDPPIDPGALVNAAAGAGGSLAQFTSGAGIPLANFRFTYLLGKAMELTAELKSLSAAFLSAKQNGDAERMSAMRAQQEATVNAAVMQLKKVQLDEATKSLESLVESRRGPVMRLQHYLALIGEPGSRIPGPGADFSEIDAQIDTPSKDSLRMSPLEKLEMDRQAASADWTLSASETSMGASITSLFPDTEENIMPFGGGVTMKIGSKMVVDSLNALANYYRYRAEGASLEGAAAARSAQLQRQLQERRLQANIAGREIKAIDKQIAAQQARIDAAAKDIETQQLAIEHAAMTIEFLRSKYTNVQLFDWMESAARNSLYNTYTLAYDMAKRAEMAFAFERGDPSIPSYIGSGSWDAAHDGLLCGDGLYLGLKKLDAAYVETRGHDFEISRHVSLRALSPLALLELRAKGAVEFALPEVLFDMDFPGHFRRRIKSVSLTIPCVVGPYTSVSCTLRLLEHKYRYTAALGGTGKSSKAPTAADYLEAAGGADARFRTNLVPSSAAAVSGAQGDAGVFEVNFRDERYMPFEGAGVVSRWRLELPQAVRPFDYDSIADVLLHVRYTAADGGQRLRTAAEAAVGEFLGRVAGEKGAEKGSLVALLDLKNDFPSEWHRFTRAEGSKRAMTLASLQSRLPFYTRPAGGLAPKASKVVMVPETPLPEGWEVSLRSTGEEKKDAKVLEVVEEGSDVSFVVAHEGAVNMGFGEDWVFAVRKTDGSQDASVTLGRMWLVVYYSLQPVK